MSKNLGPEMLAHLESKRPNMSDAEYQAHRLEIEQLIRDGKAIELTPFERALRMALIVFGVCMFFVVLYVAHGHWMAWFIAAAVLAICISVARRIGRR